MSTRSGDFAVLEQPTVAVPALPAPVAAAGEIPEIWSMRLSVLGAVLSIPALVYVLVPSLKAASLAHILSFTVYGVGLLSMFVASAIYHAEAGRERTFSKCLDYGAIGLMIAGNFTPYCAITLGTTFAHVILGLVWTLAIGALVLRITRTDLSKWVFVATFLAMGWLGVLLARPLWHALGPAGAGLTVLGGLIYTAGTLFFNRYQGDVEPPGFGPHDIWHIFILAAAGTHYAVLALYMLPR
ncbi:MAG: hemolysin III family protein [Elusimicrobia bacterium]|nr:hemolysin III family protein [Elusimicrobiota bacterium]